VWKLADFGLSSEGSSKRNLPTKYSSGTPGYRAPELMDSGGDPAMYNNKVDIWAMGCIFYELATGIRPFKSDWDVLNHRFSKRNMEVVLDDSFETGSIAAITEHIVEMLQIDPSDRPSASFLSEKFDQQLQLAHHNVLLITVTDSVTLVAKSESHQDDENEFVGVSPDEEPELAEEYHPRVYSTKLFR
jgi:serine/threonine protein kinase